MEDRKAEIEGLPMEDRDGLDLVEEYPDHPEAEVALDELLNERLPFWALPSQIRRTRSAINEYRDYLPEEGVEDRVEELKKRAAVFELDGDGSAGAVLLVIFGSVFCGIRILTGHLGLGIFGFIFIAAGLLLQYIQAKYRQEEQVENEESTSSKKCLSSDLDEVEEKGERKNKGDKDWSERRGYPAGTWHCPSCGNETTKKAGTIGTACRNCGSKMEYGKAPLFSGGLLTFLALSFVIILFIMLSA